MSTLRKAPCYLVSVALMLITAHRLPAPIAEESTPTPPPEQSAKPKPKPASKPKPKPELNESSTNPARQQPSSKQGRFAGTWVGTMQQFPFGPTGTVITVDPSETTMARRWHDAAEPDVAKAKLNGDTLQATFTQGITNTWSLTPQPDGATARVRMQAFMNDFTVIFHRAVSEPRTAKPTR